MKRHILLALLVCLLTAQVALAADRTWEVTITNVTASQIIGPPVVATHNHKARIFRAGKPASDELAAIAEDADSSGLLAALEDDENVLSVAAGSGPLFPGDSVTLMVTTSGDFQRLSAVSMLVTTNDAFFGVDSHILHDGRKDTSIDAPAYDAGSEANDELCASIPGPPCGNPFVRVTAGAEGFRPHPSGHLRPRRSRPGGAQLAQPSGRDPLRPAVTLRASL